MSRPKSSLSVSRTATALALSTALLSSALGVSGARAQTELADQTANLKNYALSLCMVKVYEKLEGEHKVAELLQQEVFAYLETATMGPNKNTNNTNKEIYKQVFVKTEEYATKIAPESALSGCLEWQANMLKQG